ncbi:uncharacterized protein LOC110677038 isoform X2 [Aedes aegypti]|nr:uncharacterized protein LOC110677038 isoform X2 [Aedes aegypti]XP_021703236.1 uncharacterized protein LOC110677038 isoform X2 [Aedes aegypti]
MVRILCAGMVNDLMKNQKYPTFDQKMTLAQKIIETFPILKVTKLSDESPDYSFFFWQNGGRGPNNEHTGLIHNHIRNECKNMSPSKKKYKRTPKRQQVTTVSSEIIEMAQRCAQLEPTSINFNSISRSMADTHDLLLMMVDANKPVNEILNVLPHLKSYNGIMIQKAYERLMPTYNKESNLKQLFARGLLNESGSFSSFQDAHVRGCLRILLRLTRRGVRKTLQSIDPDSVDIEAELAAPVIQLIENTEASLQQQLMKYVATNVHTDKEVAPHLIFNGNMYLMYIQTQVIICGTDSINALDTLFKSFTVFRLPPPATLQKILDFIEIMCYQTKRNSSRQTVNNLAKSFRDSLDAEASDSD